MQSYTINDNFLETQEEMKFDGTLNLNDIKFSCSLQFSIINGKIVIENNSYGIEKLIDALDNNNLHFNTDEITSIYSNDEFIFLRYDNKHSHSGLYFEIIYPNRIQFIDTFKKNIT